MPRSLRLVRLGVWYHITARGIERRPIFKDDGDRSHFVELIAQLPERFAVRVHAYVLMPNHYHLLISLTQPNLSQAMRWLNVSYSVWFNRGHQRCGYLFQGRYKSIIVDPVFRGLGISVYLHLNPVRTGRFKLTKANRQHDRAGIGERPNSELVRQRLEHLRSYRWNSYRAYAGLTAAPKWLDTHEIFRLGGGRQEQWTKNYRRYVEDQARQGCMDSPWEELQDRMFLGGIEFIQNIKKKARDALDLTVPPEWLREPIPLDQIIAGVEKAKGRPWKDFKERHGDGGLALVLTLAQKNSRLTLSEITRKLELKPTVNISMIIKRYRKRIEKDEPERKLAARSAKMLNAIL